MIHAILCIVLDLGLAHILHGLHIISWGLRIAWKEIMDRIQTLEKWDLSVNMVYRLAPLILLSVRDIPSLGLGSQWIFHLLFLIWGLVFLCAGKNEGDLHDNEGKNTSLGFLAFQWFVRFLTHCITSHSRLLDGCRCQVYHRAG